MSTQAHYKYVGDGHTWLRLEKGAEKVKVGHGEIIQTDLPAKDLVFNGFRKVEFDADGKEIVNNPKAADVKAPKVYTSADFTKKQMLAIVENRKIELPGNAKNNAQILAVLTKELSAEDMAAEVAAAFPAEEAPAA